MQSPLRRRRLASTTSYLMLCYHASISILLNPRVCSSFTIELPDSRVCSSFSIQLCAGSQFKVSRVVSPWFKCSGSALLSSSRLSHAANKKAQIIPKPTKQLAVWVSHLQKPSSSPVSGPLLNPMLPVLSKPPSVSSSNDEKPPSPKPLTSPLRPVR